MSLEKQRITRREFVKTAFVASLPLLGIGSYGKQEESLTAQKATLFQLLIQPFIAEAEVLRGSRKENDGEYSHRVDENLNSGRINTLLFCSAETREPPLITNPGHYIASPTIVSLDYVNGLADIISFTHDIWAPDIDRAMGVFGQPGSAHRIEMAHIFLNPQVGGFNLSQKLFESMTGLAMDFQVHFKDETIQQAVDRVFDGQVQVELAQEIPLQDYFYKGELYDEAGRIFPKGKTDLNGRETVGFMSAIAQYAPGDSKYSYLHEHNERKNLVLNALLKSEKERCWNPMFWLGIKSFVEREIEEQRLAFDFDYYRLLIDTLVNVVPAATWAVFQGMEAGFPQMGIQEYIVDNGASKRGTTGDRSNVMPVHWKEWTEPGEVSKQQAENMGLFRKDLAYEVPYYGDPFSPDLVRDYWGSVRRYVARAIRRQPITSH